MQEHSASCFRGEHFLDPVADMEKLREQLREHMEYPQVVFGDSWGSTFAFRTVGITPKRVPSSAEAHYFVVIVDSVHIFILLVHVMFRYCFCAVDGPDASIFHHSGLKH